MRIVSNTGPLIGLAKIDCLYILKQIASGKPGTVRVDDPLLLISLDLDEPDIHGYTDR